MQSKKGKNTGSAHCANQQTANATLFNELQQQFKQWRANKSKKDCVPQALHQAVVSAIDNGMPTSKLGLLHLSSGQLKRWRLQQTAPEKTLPQFVAVEPINDRIATTNNLLQSRAGEFELAIHYPHGLRVDIRVCDAATAAQLLKTLY